MAEHLSDILEQILVRLDVRDLIRCKTVCKSWLSLISEPHFIKAHLNHNYNNDLNNNEISDRRIVPANIPSCVRLFEEAFGPLGHMLFDFQFLILGSSNGLVCIHDFSCEVLVINPSTRVVKKLQDPQISEIKGSLFWGFGYDSSTDDYKVVLGFVKGENQTCFQVLTLKSLVWKVIGEVNYDCVGSSVGILCNGALHWFMDDASSALNKKTVILSFDLSTEEFKEIPQPDGFFFHHCSYELGILNDCLCIYYCRLPHEKVWIMKEYNVKESWGMLGHDYEIKYEAIHTLKEFYRGTPERYFCEDKWLCKTLDFINDPIFVPSLVSPYLNGSLKRKSQPMETQRNDKLLVFKEAVFKEAVSQLIEADPSVPGPSTR